VSDAITIRLDIGRIIYLIGAVSIVLLGLYLVYTEASATYTIVIPTNTLRAIHGFFKNTMAVKYVDLSSGIEPLSITTGSAFNIILDALPTGYAIVILRGVNLYMLTVVIVAVIVYLAISRRILRKVNTRTLLAYIVFTLMATTSIVSTLFYSSLARNAGYEYSETPLTIRFNNLNYTDLDQVGQSLIVNVSSGLLKLRYLYSLSDTANSLSLVKVQLVLNDTAYPITYINASAGQTILLGNSSTVFYTGRGTLAINILSDQLLNNSILLYYKLEFYQGPISEPSTMIIITPLILTISTIIIGVLLSRINTPQRPQSTP